MWANLCDIKDVPVLRRTVMSSPVWLACGSADLQAVNLVVGELLANVAQHAPGPLSVEISCSAERAVFILHDSGTGFKARAVPARLPRRSASHGRGLFIIEALGGSVEVRARPGQGSRVRVELPIGRPASAASPAS